MPTSSLSTTKPSPVNRQAARHLPQNSLSRRNWRALFATIVIIVDLVAIFSSRLLAYALTYPERFSEELVFSSFEHFGGYCLIAYFGVGVINGLYRSPYRSSLRRQFKIAANSYLYGSFLWIGMIFLLKLHLNSRGFVVLVLILLPIIFAFLRFFVNRLNISMQRRGHGVSNTLIAGISNEGLQIYKRFSNLPELGYSIKGFVSTDGPVDSADFQSYEFQDLPNIIAQQNIECVLLPTDTVVQDSYKDLEKLCRNSKVRLKLISTGAEALLEKANVHDIAGITLFSPDAEKNIKLRKYIKRAFDIFASAAALLVLSPLLLAAVLAIKLESRGSILFRQYRALANGSKKFIFYKFRTMVEDAEERKNHLYEYNESNGALFKMKADPRVTKVGKFLRRWSIDELPQLFNVLKGDMSLVGPRPLPVEDLERLDSKESLGGYYAKRAQAIPGVTGLWQIAGRSDLGFTEMVLLDLYYIENESLVLDLEILFATIPVVLFGKGAY